MGKFNKEICDKIIKQRSDGATIKECAELVGVNRRTIHEWIKKGESEYTAEYYDFYLRMLEARSLFIKKHKKIISESDDWRAHKYLLEVTDPDTYVLEKRVQLKADENVNMNVKNESVFDVVDRELGLGKYAVADEKEDDEE